MLRDDAIKAGLIKPTKADIERMWLADEQPDEEVDMTVAQIKAELDARGIEYDDKARKAALIELIKDRG